MAALQVAGAIALMLEANPNLTPNLVKAILQVHRPELSAIQRSSRAPASWTFERGPLAPLLPRIALGHKCRCVRHGAST